MTGLSIIVVTWNCAGFIYRFLGELKVSLQEVPDFEVLILDNASSDGTADLVESSLPDGFRMVRSSENLGFAKGNNVLIREAKHPNIVLLNPDVFEYPDGFWKRILERMTEHQADVGFVRLNNADGSFQDCIGEFPSPSRAWKSLLKRHPAYDGIVEPAPIEAGVMAFMIAKRSTWDEIGLIDEDFHMYCEDIEWCYRAGKANKKVMYFPDLQLTHLGGASAEMRWKGLRKQLIKYQSEQLFVDKHHRGGAWVAMTLLGCLKRTVLRTRMILK